MLAVTQLSGFGTSVQEGDPYWSNVSALYHFDGANGGTTFIDSSNNNVTPTVVGNSQTSTDQSMFGGASYYSDGSGDRLEVYYGSASVVDFGTADFTIESWVYRLTTGVRQFIMDTRGSGSGTIGIRIESNNVLQVIDSAGAAIFTGTTSMNTLQWYNIAVSRSGTTMRFFIDGVQEGSVTNSTSYTQTTGGRYIIGASGFALGNVPLNGYLDEFRITKDVARYTADYTTQWKAFPNSS